MHAPAGPPRVAPNNAPDSVPVQCEGGDRNWGGAEGHQVVCWRVGPGRRGGATACLPPPTRRGSWWVIVMALLRGGVRCEMPDGHAHQWHWGSGWRGQSRTKGGHPVGLAAAGPAAWGSGAPPSSCPCARKKYCAAWLRGGSWWLEPVVVAQYGGMAVREPGTTCACLALRGCRG